MVRAGLSVHDRSESPSGPILGNRPRRAHPGHAPYPNARTIWRAPTVFLTGVEYRLADGPVLGRLIARFAAVIGMPLKSETNHAGHQQGALPVARFTHGKALAVRPIGACFLRVKVTSLDDGSAPAGIQDRGGEYSTRWTDRAAAIQCIVRTFNQALCFEPPLHEYDLHGHDTLRRLAPPRPFGQPARGGDQPLPAAARAQPG